MNIDLEELSSEFKNNVKFDYDFYFHNKKKSEFIISITTMKFFFSKSSVWQNNKNGKKRKISLL